MGRDGSQSLLLMVVTVLWVLGSAGIAPVLAGEFDGLCLPNPDGDADVDVDEEQLLSLLLTNWGQDVNGDWHRGERNGVAPVDDNDLSCLLGNWMGPVGRRAVSPTGGPEVGCDDIDPSPGANDDKDLSLLLANWGTNAGYCGGDWGSNGIVDDDDLSILLANWTGSWGSVPEPATLCLLAVGAIVLVRPRHKRTRR